MRGDGFTLGTRVGYKGVTRGLRWVRWDISAPVWGVEGRGVYATRCVVRAEPSDPVMTKPITLYFFRHVGHAWTRLRHGILCEGFLGEHQ
jgi:hypothetical protein